MILVGADILDAFEGGAERSLYYLLEPLNNLDFCLFQSQEKKYENYNKLPNFTCEYIPYNMETKFSSLWHHRDQKTNKANPELFENHLDLINNLVFEYLQKWYKDTNPQITFGITQLRWSSGFSKFFKEHNIPYVVFVRDELQITYKNHYFESLKNAYKICACSNTINKKLNDVYNYNFVNFSYVPLAIKYPNTRPPINHENIIKLCIINVGWSKGITVYSQLIQYCKKNNLTNYEFHFYNSPRFNLKEILPNQVFIHPFTPIELISKKKYINLIFCDFIGTGGRVIHELGFYGIPSISNNMDAQPEMVGKGGLIIEDLYNPEEILQAILTINNNYGFYSKNAQKEYKKTDYKTSSKYLEKIINLRRNRNYDKNKIFITGCAKTGTTLLRRLFNSFEGLNVYNYDEITIERFINSEYDVGKRANGPFSFAYDDTQTKYFLGLFKNINIINIVRNKEDVLKSDNGYVDEIRYNDCMKQAASYSKYIDYTLIYENLMKFPDVIQKEISDKFGLVIKYKWSEYPKFVEGIEENPQTQKGIYALRPIGAKKVTQTNNRRNLVFTSAGGNTNFDELWLEENRNYDVWVIFYGDDENKFQQYKEKVEFIEKRKGDKWQNFYYAYNTYKEQLKEYTHFFILDDDIIISTDDIKKMFSIAKESTLWICQPSFGKDSRLGHLINKHNPHYYLRYTNFVENNTPLMTREAIDNFFTLYNTDELDPHGTDFTYIWANGIEEKKRYAIIDSIKCVNPVDRIINGEKVRDCLNINSLEKQVEKWHLFNKKNNIPYWMPKTHQYVPFTKMQIELTKSNFSTVVDVKFDEKLSIPPSTEDKIALLFLTRNNLKHPQLWYDFINDAKGKCNVYAHTKEKDLITQDFLKEAQIPTHIDTKWGDYSLVKAVNELIRAAVKDPTNKFFVVLCESAIPIHKFGPIYQFLFKNQKSILYTKLTPRSKNDLKEVCNLITNPSNLNLNADTIIRNSQWMIITREHAEIIARTNHEEEFKNFPIADEWYHWNVLQYYDKDFSTKVLNFKPIYFQYDLNDMEDPLPHPIEVTDKELIMDVKQNYYSLFFRKVSPVVTIEYREL